MIKLPEWGILPHSTSGNCRSHNKYFHSFSINETENMQATVSRDMLYAPMVFLFFFIFGKCHKIIDALWGHEHA
jgi:hypothetical protein